MERENVAASIKKLLSSSLFLFASTQAFSLDLPQGHPLFQVGAYFSSQGKSQDVSIQDLIGDNFSITRNNDNNVLWGIGYLLDGPTRGRCNWSYGLNLFYLPSTTVAGVVTQEQLFTNLAYSYDISHLPLYVDVKTSINNDNEKYALTLDAGIGPNFMHTSNFHEVSLDDGFTLPDNIYSGRSSTTFSVTAGIGLKANHLIGRFPFECGYRFFYLGQSDLNKQTDQVLTALVTGHNYANAIVCTATI